MTTLSSLLTARTSSAILASFYTEMDAAEVSLEGLQTTSILRALPDIVARNQASGEDARLALTAGGYLTGAEGLSGALTGYLDLLGEDFFQLYRDPAINTIGMMRITAGTGAGTSTIGTGDLVVAYGFGATQVLFTNTEGFTPIVGSSVAVTMRAQLPGVAGNIATGSTLKLITAYPGLSVTNPAITGQSTWITTRGKERESQASYARRIRARWADLGPATVAERFALLVRYAFTSAGLSSPITRIYPDDTNPLGPGSAKVYLATDSGPASVADVARVQAYIQPRWAVGAGPFLASAAAVYTIAITGTIKGPTSESTAQDQAAVVLANLESLYPIGGTTVYLEQIRSALLVGVTGAVNVVLSAPAIDTPIPAGSIVSFTPITLTVAP
jgi:hypothetical protein